MELTKGLCAPEARDGDYAETWQVSEMRRLPAADYDLEAVFVSNGKRASFQATGGGDQKSFRLATPVSLGSVRVE
jgi:hypothetical protein